MCGQLGIRDDALSTVKLPIVRGASRELQTLSGTNIVVIVASCGRADALEHLLGRLRAQTLPPIRVILAVTADEDVPASAQDDPAVLVALGKRGLCAQRNTALDAVASGTDAVVFFDDDYVPSRFAIASVAAAFEDDPDLVGFDGTVLADGVRIGGIGADEATRIVDASDAAHDPSARPTVRFGKIGLYGCNMAFRWARVRDLRFDERLPLYGWQEDIDFSRRVLRGGETLGESNLLTGVHRGVRTSRSPGRSLGYSQVANPFYLVRKGTMPPLFALRLVARNITANAVRYARPEPWVDRRGRLAGNLAGLGDLLVGRSEPERAARL